MDLTECLPLEFPFGQVRLWYSLRTYTFDLPTDIIVLVDLFVYKQKRAVCSKTRFFHDGRKEFRVRQKAVTHSLFMNIYCPIARENGS